MKKRFRYTLLIRDRLQIKSYGNLVGADPLKCTDRKKKNGSFFWNHRTFFFVSPP